MSKKSENPEPPASAEDVTADLVASAAIEPVAAEAPLFVSDAGDAPTAAHTQVAPVVQPGQPVGEPPAAMPPGYAVAAPVPPGSVPPGAVGLAATAPDDDAQSTARKRTLVTALIGAGVGLIAGLSLGVGGTLLASDDHDGRGFDSGQVQGRDGRHGGWDQQQGGQQQGNQQQGGQVPSGQQQGGFDQQNGATPGGQMPGQNGPGGMTRSGGS